MCKQQLRKEKNTMGLVCDPKARSSNGLILVGCLKHRQSINY